MRKIKSVRIEGFWGDKTVILDFNDNINFLIGVNGSGKTTIINLIAASLNADFTTLDKAEFNRIKVDFHSDNESKNDSAFIEVVKKEKNDSPYPNIIFTIKLPKESKPKTFKLNELEEEIYYRYPKDYLRQRIHRMGAQIGRDINLSLQSIVNLTWLSIHRASRNMHQEEKSLESSIDQKVKELSTELIKYFGVLDKQYSIETEKFQKNVFLSLIEGEKPINLLETDDLDSQKEQESLKQIFLLFKLEEVEFSSKLEKHFKGFDEAKTLLKDKKTIQLDKLSYILGTRRIHSIVQEWIDLNEKKTLINKPKLTFIAELNKLYQRKQLFINEKNELRVRTESGKEFNLINLSSGEKQLLIILGESLLQENKSHVYIADEPELSLHVEWQEKLVGSLKGVNPNSQIIFATHSPDIVGSYSNCVIKVETCIA
ncbi:MAG: hemin importer ATP-binding subunit [Sphingobacteriaceae bacterium]|jgi:predicted ATPase|nr:hemin importer ATP-binding subunit [Sphingobacteriaceae bacterium]